MARFYEVCVFVPGTESNRRSSYCYHLPCSIVQLSPALSRPHILQHRRQTISLVNIVFYQVLFKEQQFPLLTVPHLHMRELVFKMS